MDYAKINELALQQENELRFNTFNHKTAWDLGCFMVDRIYKQGIELVVSIRELNGYILFQHGTETTNLNNQNWLRRKFNTVVLTERSSYGAWADANAKGETPAFHGLSDADYAFCGGGFPIRLQSGEMVGVLLVSNLPHEEDHQFIIDSLREWLQAEEK